MITKKRIEFKPFHYEWAYEYWFNQQSAHWLHTEINMNSDILDWERNLNKNEKEIVGKILKGFAQIETYVGDYWSSMIPKWFPVPEIKMMAQTFGAMETIHAVAYAYLNDTLGLDNFKAFLDDEATMKKLEVLMNVNSKTTNLSEIAKSIALFSAAAEGIQLFSSFAVLLSFRPSNKLRGIGQQMIYSIRDESMHSEAGCKLFRTLINENPEINTEELRNKVVEGIDLALQNELFFIDQLFENGELETISKEQLVNFMRSRANLKLEELGLKPHYIINSELLNEMQWFYDLVSGEQQTDFFANKETGYSKANQDWNNQDLF